MIFIFLMAWKFKTSAAIVDFGGSLLLSGNCCKTRENPKKYIIIISAACLYKLVSKSTDDWTKHFLNVFKRLGCRLQVPIQVFRCFLHAFDYFFCPQLKDFEAKKRKELHEKIQHLKESEDILKKKLQDLNKAGMEKQIDNLRCQLREASNEKRQWESEIRGLKDEVARLAEQLRLAQRPFWKRWLGIDS